MGGPRFVIPLCQTVRMASVFKTKVNPVLGKVEWSLDEENYDFVQEIARSGYADMLHDTGRNLMFQKAIEKVLDRRKLLGQKVHVLDIGTGTGLLAMMAARCGADKVSAVEAFHPVATVAKQIIERNGFSENIQVICSRSTDILTEEEIGEKANVAVAEVFDTELIGEGALRTFKHAHSTLLQWRDHWMQAIYYFSNSCSDSSTIIVRAAHDEYSFWFDCETQTNLHNTGVPVLKPPVCECGLHAICSRMNLGRLNDCSRYQKFAKALGDLSSSVALSVSDCSLLPLLLAQLSADHVFAVAGNAIANRIVQDYIDANHLSGKVTLLESLDQIPDTAKSATLFAVPVELENLWKIRAPVGNVCGFDLSLFDQLIQRAMDTVDASVEPQPLWEYPSTICGEVTPIFVWDFYEQPTVNTSTTVEATFHLQRPGTNGIAMWMEWKLNGDNTINDGLESGRELGAVPRWYWHSRQGIYFLPQHLIAQKLSRLNISVTFDSRLGDLKFSFGV